MARSRPIVRGVVPALVALLAAATLAACGNERVTTPTARPGAPLAAVVGDSVVAGPTFAVIGPAGFQETFTHTADPNSLAAPTPWQPADWAIVRHQRDTSAWYAVEPMMAWHGSMCQKPDDAAEPTHRVASYDGTYDSMMFLCRNHMMTANNSSGYGVIYMTPNRMVDFSAGTAVVRFDVATKRESGRDWIDLWLTPYADNLVTPLEDSLPDLQGAPRRAVHVRMTDSRTRSAFQATVVRNFAGTTVPVRTTDGYETAFAARGLTPSATRRDTFELHISRTHIKFGMPRYNLWWVDAEVADLGWSQAVLQIGHHSFNPTADGGTPSSWHWDNIGMQPAVPFTILRADRRFVDDTSTDEVVFPRGAPDGAHLRFSALGATDVWFMQDGDEDDEEWSAARLQGQKHNDPKRFASYWMPVPEGTTRIRLRANPARSHKTAGPWMARDISIWAGPPLLVTSGNNKDKTKHLLAN